MEETQQVEDDHGWNRESLLGSGPTSPRISNISYSFDPGKFYVDWN